MLLFVIECFCRGVVLLCDWAVNFDYFGWFICGLILGCLQLVEWVVFAICVLE